MGENTVGVKELKARLSGYLRRVKAGSTLTITERGKPVGRIVPVSPSAQGKARGLVDAGLVRWSGRKLQPLLPPATTKGTRTVADLLLEDRE